MNIFEWSDQQGESPYPSYLTAVGLRFGSLDLGEMGHFFQWFVDFDERIEAVETFPTLAEAKAWAEDVVLSKTEQLATEWQDIWETLKKGVEENASQESV